ncbi:hypothetical protein ACJJTC_014782 [Scirpophaga incertulas]
MAKKLHYFDVNGIAESIRYILHYGGQKFEDIKYKGSEWPIESVKNILPYGQLPFYEEGNKSLNQSVAIARYLASQTGLLPSDPWEQAVLDAIVLTISDFWNKTKPAEYINEQDPTKKAAIRAHIYNELIPYYFSRFEKHLKANNGHFGGKLTWADFMFVGTLEAVNLIYNLNADNGYPTIAALLKTVRNLPKVKEYIANRKPYAF